MIRAWEDTFISLTSHGPHSSSIHPLIPYMSLRLIISCTEASTAVSSLASSSPPESLPGTTHPANNNAGGRNQGSQMSYVMRTILEKDFFDSSIKDGLEENQQQAHQSSRTYWASSVWATLLRALEDSETHKAPLPTPLPAPTGTWFRLKRPHVGSYIIIQGMKRPVNQQHQRWGTAGCD